MRKLGFTVGLLACVLLCVPLASGRNYALVISAGQATRDDASVNSCFWYNFLLIYQTLLDQGFEHDDIYALYGYRTNFNSRYPCYQVPYTVADYAVNRANIRAACNALASRMTPNDFLYIWWMGHGSPSGNHLVMYIETTGESVYDYEIANWLAPVDYDVRTVSWMTCFSGGILDDLDGPRSIVMSSATFYESTYDVWVCDNWHAEFHYPERCAWAWETPCGQCGSVDADSNNDGAVCFQEAFIYARNHTDYSTPQMSDVGNLAPITFLGQPGTTTETVVPTSYSIVSGQRVSGGLNSLFESDNARLVLEHAGFFPPAIELEVVGTAPTDAPEELTFRFEGHVTATQVTQTIKLYNYANGFWEQADVRTATTADSVVEIVISSNAARFVEPGTQQLKARIHWMGTSFMNLYGWYSRTDQTVWEVTY